jgi:hypothetical protein
MRRKITACTDRHRANAASWVVVALMLAAFASPSQALTPPPNVQAWQVAPTGSPALPVKVEHDPGVDPQPFARPNPQRGSDNSLAAGLRGSGQEPAGALPTLVSARPCPTRSRDGAAWRVGFGWRAPPVRV